MNVKIALYKLSVIIKRRYIDELEDKTIKEHRNQ